MAETTGTFNMTPSPAEKITLEPSSTSFASEAELRSTVRAFLKGRLGSVSINDDDDIFVTGIVNSMFAIQLVGFVEKNLGVPVSNDDLELSNFRSVDAIVRFVRSKQGER